MTDHVAVNPDGPLRRAGEEMRRPRTLVLISCLRGAPAAAGACRRAVR